MRRIFSVLVVAVLFASFAFLSPKAISARGLVCLVFEATLTNGDAVSHSTSFRFVDVDTGLDVSRTVSITLQPGETGTLRLAAFVPVGHIFPIGSSLDGLTLVSHSTGFDPGLACNDGSPSGIFDGRLNPSDLAAPVVAYCEGKAVAVYDINASGQGHRVFIATRAEIDAALASAIASGHNVVIKRVYETALYALSSNELTLVGRELREGKLYQRVLPPGVCS
jgi:hypothetical protein